MNPDELEQLVAEVIASAEVMGYPISPASAAMMAEMLAPFPPRVTLQALGQVRMTHKGRLTPAVIFEKVERIAGRLAPDDAFALALKARDERYTVVWNNEIAQAWSAASPLANAGELISARMAFIAAYERITSEARGNGLMPQPQASIGWDSEQRDRALLEACSGHRMSYTQAIALSPSLQLPPGVSVPESLQLQDTRGKQDQPGPPPEQVASRLEELRDWLSRKANRPTRRQVIARAERIALIRRKRETQERVDAFHQSTQSA